MLETRGNRKEICEILKQISLTNISSLKYNGNCYSKNKKIYPLQISNIFNNKDLVGFHCYNKIDPDVVKFENLTNLSFSNLKLENLKCIPLDAKKVTTFSRSFI